MSREDVGKYVFGGTAFDACRMSGCGNSSRLNLLTLNEGLSCWISFQCSEILHNIAVWSSGSSSGS